MSSNAQQKVAYFGHRGCRGVYPENTIKGFQKALEEPIDGIEWDVIVNKDKQLVISHETYPDAQYCLDSMGNELNKADQKKYNFYNMSLAEIQSFDCGSKSHSRFTEQENEKNYKPTVQEAFNQLDLSNTTILFEIKSEEKEYNISQPSPVEYAQIIKKEIENFDFKENIIFMCFDPLLLIELHNILPEYKYVYLTYQPIKTINQFLSDIDFTPYALGMYHITIRKKDIKQLNQRNVKTFAWTVNSTSKADKLVRYGIDGIITDFPDRINHNKE